MPFCQAAGLIYNLARFQCLAVESLVNDKDRMLFMLFQLEVRPHN